MKLSISGTRDGWTEQQREVFLALLDTTETIDEFHYGDCVGVDEQALWEIVIDNNPWLYIYPARVRDEYRANTFSKLGGYPNGITLFQPLPPMERNRYIVEGTDQLWAFPGRGRGTWNAIKHADDLGIKTRIVTPEGILT